MTSAALRGTTGEASGMTPVSAKHAEMPKNIPPELASLPRWVCWTYKALPSGLKTKIPVQPDGRPASTTDPATWRTYDEVREKPYVGFVFVRADGFVGIDLDHVLREGGGLCTWARSLVAEADSYTEVSPSGTGLHVICRGTRPAWLPKREDMPEDEGLECYDSGRYFTMTGRVFEGHATVRSVDLEALFGFLKPLYERTPARAPTTAARRFDLRLEDVLPPGFHPGVRYAHPYHGSATSANFMVSDRGTWRCWRHSFTGGALHLLGIRYGVVKCGEKPTKAQWHTILQRAEAEGIIPKHGWKLKGDGSVKIGGAAP